MSKLASRKRYEQIASLDLPTFLENEFSHDPMSPFKNLRKMQKSALRISNTTRNTIIAAPSQSGKSTKNLGRAVPVLFLPEGYFLYITNSAANAEEMFQRFMVEILGDPRGTKTLLKQGITRQQKRGLRYPELTEIGVKTGKEEITIAATGARFRFAVASEDALAGKSPDVLILDEPPLYPQKLQKLIYDEAEARLGNSQGYLLETSTVRKYGETIHLPNGNTLYQGDVFYARLSDFKRRQQQGDPNVAALDYTYHCSERLTTSVPLSNMSTQGKKNHYWGIPLASDEQPMFIEFDPQTHIIPDITPEKIDHHETDRWAAGADPGNTTAYALLQFKVFPKPKIIVHYTWQTKTIKDGNTTRLERFSEISLRVAQELGAYLGEHIFKIRFHCDVAGKALVGNADTTYAQQMNYIFGQYPILQKQSRASGTNLMRMYLREPGAFEVCKRCTHLITFLKEAVPEINKDTGEREDTYVKDGREHCFVAGTLVTTDRGQVPIENVTTEDKVLTRKGYKQVIASGISGFNRETITVITTHSAVTCTPEHLIWVVDKGWTRADTIRYDDKVLIALESAPCQNMSTITGSNTAATLNLNTNQTQIILDVQTGNTPQVMSHTCTEESGLTTSDQSQKDTTSTTKTVTPETTSSTTLNASQQANTLPNTPKTTGQKKQKPQLESDSSQSTTLQNPGTLVQKVESGIAIQQKEFCGETTNLSTNLVNNAKKYSKQKSEITLTDSAQIIASLHGEEKKALITKQEYVDTVVKTTPQTNIVKYDIAVECVQKVQLSPVEEKVYDLTIQDEPEFFANNILVHNCGDITRYIMSNETCGRIPSQQTNKTSQITIARPY